MSELHPTPARDRRGRGTRSWRRELLEWLGAFAAAAAVALVLHLLVFQLIGVEGPSMQPTLHTQQRLLSTPITYMLREPVRGEVVITTFPGRGRTYFVKRVIGLPGETVAIRDGAVYINGERLAEPYIREAIDYTMAETLIPEDHYFLLGDNRNNSTDSHSGHVGPIPRSMLKGKVQAVVWPLNELAWITAPDYGS